MPEFVSITYRTIDGTRKTQSIDYLIFEDAFGHLETVKEYSQAWNVQINHRLMRAHGLSEKGISSIEEIDLSPLVNCTNLQYVTIEEIELTKLDLTPLVYCHKLSGITIESVSLEELDLTPLASCRKFEVLDLTLPRLSSLDLTPLAQCSQLFSLQLRAEKSEEHADKRKRIEIQSINLTPLEHCTNLKSLIINDTKVTTLDLTILSQCPLLTTIDFTNNRLEEVDLTPLSKLSNLYSVDLGYNRIKELDLKPLSNRIMLAILSVEGNQIESLNITSLFSCPRLAQLRIDPDVSLFADPSLRSSYGVSPAITEHRRQKRVSFLSEKDNPDIDEAPTVIKELWNIVRPYQSVDPRISPCLIGAKSLPYNDETKSLLKKFKPEIRTHGWDLYIERRKTEYWGGLLARAVELEPSRKDQRQVCLQYIYIWTRQLTLFSIHWWVIIPLFMTLIGIGLWFLWAPEIAVVVSMRNDGLLGYALWPGLAYFFLWMEIIIIAFEPYFGSSRKDPYKPNPHLQPAIGTGIIGVSSLAFGVFPEILLFYIIISMIVLILAGVSIKSGKFGHDMDYLPVFVWIMGLAELGWMHMSTCWDYWHYYSAKKDSSALLEPDDHPILMYEASAGSFIIDNPWHSMRLYSRTKRNSQMFRVKAAGLLTILLVPALLLIGILLGLPDSFVHAARILLVFLLSLVVLRFSYSGVSELIRDDEIDDNMHHLSDSWLDTLWNLFDYPMDDESPRILSQRQKEKAREPRLKVISKLQAPFISDPDFWTTFQDDPEYLYGLKLKSTSPNETMEVAEDPQNTPSSE